MDKKNSFFRGYRHMNRSLTRLTDKSKSKQPLAIPKDDDNRPEPSSVVPTTLEAALEKANLAVLYDSTDNPLDAMHAYVEAVELLRKVFTEETDTDDLARLCKIHNSYTDRIRTLSEQTGEPVTDPTMLQTITEEMTSTWRLKRRSKKPSRPPSLVNDSLASQDYNSQPATPVSYLQQDCLSTHTTESTRSNNSGSIFSNMFAKRSQTRLTKHSNPSMHSLAPTPKSSRSTPIAGLGRSAKSWRSAAVGSRNKNRHSSDFTDEIPHRHEEEEDEDPLPPLPPSLPLPAVETSSSDDYFNFGSSNLLYQSSTYTSLLNSGRDNTNKYRIKEPQQLHTPASPPASTKEKQQELHTQSSPQHQWQRQRRPSSPPPSHNGSSSKSPSLKERTRSRSPPPTSHSRKQSLAKKPSSGSQSLKKKTSQEVCPLSPSSSTKSKHAKRISISSMEPVSPTPTASLSSFWRSHSRRTTKHPSSLDITDRASIMSGSSCSSPASPTGASFAAFEAPKSKSANKIDPGVFLGEPEELQGDGDDESIMQRLLRCMQHGGYITRRIHVPRQVWYQTHVRLPVLDAKLETCTLLIDTLDRLSTLSHDPNGLCRDLTALEATLDQLSRSKNFHVDSTSQQHVTHSSPNHHPSAASSLASWSSKLSKSVERMKLDSRTLEGKHHAYIHTLIQLFSAAQILDALRMQYTESITRIPADKVVLHSHVLSKSQTCLDMLNRVVAGFVLQDFQLLLAKWIKRSREWTCE